MVLSQTRSHLPEYQNAVNTLIAEYIAANNEDQKRLEEEIRNKLKNRPPNTLLSLSSLGSSNDPQEKMLKNIDLSNLDLSYITFTAIAFQNVLFDGSNLTWTSFCGRDNKNHMVIKDSSFKGSTCIQTVFTNTDLRGSVFDDSTIMEQPDFTGAWLSSSILNFLIPKAHYLNEPNNRPAINLKKISFKDENLRGLNLSGLYVHDCYFKGTDLAGVSFKNTDVKGSIFKGAKNISDGQFSLAINANNAHFDSSVKTRQDNHRKAVKGTAMITNYLKRITQDAQEGGLVKQIKIDDGTNKLRY